MHVCRIQEEYLRHSRGPITLVGKTLQKPRKMVYRRNGYDWCFMKQIFNDKQFTILWHVDNLNMSHIDAEISTGILADID